MELRIPNEKELPWLKPNLLMYGISGSHAYGMATEASDKDYRGIAVAPYTYNMGFGFNFEQTQSNVDGDDVVIYELKKFLKLAAQCNPNIIELLFLPEETLMTTTPEWLLLVQERSRFITKRAYYTFSGYAASQLKRIQGHRNWLLNPPKKKPERADFGLPETTLIPADQLGMAKAQIQKELDRWEIDYGDLPEASKIFIASQLENVLTDWKLAAEDKFFLAGKKLGFSDSLLEIAEHERRYENAKKSWQQYNTWKESRNVKRAELEAKHGYDTKHASHLVRLICMCEEILQGKGVLVKRDNANELLMIRSGKWTYEELMSWVEEKEVSLQTLHQESKLPKSPDLLKLNNLCVQMHENFYNRTV